MAPYKMKNEVKELYKTWMCKATEYNSAETNFPECYDKFFTLFVAYNMLYTELAYKVNGRKYFRDDKAATKYVKEYVRARHFIAGIEQDVNCVSALKRIIHLLDGRQQPDGQPRFCIVLDPRNGEPAEGEDKKLLTDLMGRSKDHKSGAILTLIYNIRCNMFHGRKEFCQEQLILLSAIIVLLEKVIKLLYDKLSSEGSRAW